MIFEIIKFFMWPVTIFVSWLAVRYMLNRFEKKRAED